MCGIVISLDEMSSPVAQLKGELSQNFRVWDESARGWSTYWKVVTQNTVEFRK